MRRWNVIIIAVGILIVHLHTQAVYGALPASSRPLQFIAGSHILGFQPGGLIIAAPDHVLKISFKNARPVEPVADRQTAPARQVPPLGAVTYSELWPGISLTYEAAEGTVAKSTLRLKPGARVADIRLCYNVPVTVDDTGGLRFQFSPGSFRESPPVAWQEKGGRKVPVTASYRLRGKSEVGFAVKGVDPNLPLVIDPNLTWNTFLGANMSFSVGGMTVDADGNIYITGSSSANFPVSLPKRPHSGSGDAFVAKLGISGGMQWYTFLGGAGSDNGFGIAVGNGIYVTGYSSGSWGSPRRSFTGGFLDAFAAKLTPDGILEWNTFLGGNGDDAGHGIAEDDSGNVYVSGYSQAEWSEPLRDFSGDQDAFVAKLNISGDLQWNTFLGGAGWDYGSHLAVDSFGTAYVIGTSNTNWGAPLRPFTGASDAFVARLNANGTLEWHVFLGGSDFDYGHGAALDNGGYLYVTGSSRTGWGVPLRPHSGGDDAFVAQLTVAGALQWTTFLGGTGADAGRAITIHNDGVYLTGESGASWGAPLRGYTAGTDAFAARLSTSGVLQWNTFLGGTGADTGRGIGVTPGENVCVYGESDPSWSYSSIYTWTGLYDAFVTWLSTDGTFRESPFGSNRFYGAYGDTAGSGIAVDNGGNVYIAGTSFTSWGSPLNPHSGENDVFVAKLNSSGALVWNTFLGGADDDDAGGLVIDGSANVYVTGSSRTTWGSPLRGHSPHPDAFIAKLSSGGVLQWSTFLGGGNTTVGQGIALDHDRNVYLSGYSMASWGSPLRPFAGSSDAFVAKLDSGGALLWNTFLGGNEGDDGPGIAVDPEGNPYVTGRSGLSWGVPVVAFTGLSDAFVAKLNTNGALVWNTFLGGIFGDGGKAIVVDGGGNCYVVGESDNTWGNPLRPFSGGIGVFATKLNNAGVLQWNTFLGNYDLNRGDGIALDPNGNLYVAGYNSLSWGDPLQPLSGPADAFVAGLSNDGALLWNTFLGGPAWDFGTAVAVGPDGNIYLAGYSGAEWGNPVRAFQGPKGFDVFAAKVDKFFYRYLPMVGGRQKINFTPGR